MIAVGDRGAQFIHITWTADTHSSLYVVQSRKRSTQLYSRSLAVRDVPYTIHYDNNIIARARGSQFLYCIDIVHSVQYHTTNTCD
jgi:hypothetical protein